MSSFLAAIQAFGPRRTVGPPQFAETAVIDWGMNG